MGWAFAWFKALGFGCWELGAGLWAKGEGLEQKDWVQVKEFWRRLRMGFPRVEVKLLDYWENAWSFWDTCEVWIVRFRGNYIKYIYIVDCEIHLPLDACTNKLINRHIPSLKPTWATELSLKASFICYTVFIALLFPNFGLIPSFASLKGKISLKHSACLHNPLKITNILWKLRALHAKLHPLIHIL